MAKRFVLVGALALAEAACAVEVASRTLSVTLDEAGRGAVSRLVTARGADLGAVRGTAPLFDLKFTRTDDFAKSVSASSQKATAFRVERIADGVRLVYGGLCEACGEVVCTVRGGGEYVRWGISADVKPGWALEETTYPKIRLTSCLGTSPEDDVFVKGSAKGGLVRNPGAKGRGWWAFDKQPGPLVAQFAALYDDRAGFYYAAEDAAGHVKYLGAAAHDGDICFMTRRLGFDSGMVVQQYDVVTGGFEGTPANPCTWHDAADLYKAWAERQTWCRTPFRDRADVPAWMRDAPAMVRFHREWLKNPQSIRDWMANYWLREYPAAPLVMAYWGWEKHDTWVTPDYFPVVPDDATFARLVGDLRKMGGHAFPWPSGYHWTLMYKKLPDGSFEWDDRARFDRIGNPHAVFDRNGTRYDREPGWLQGGHTACMCGGDPWTIDWWNNDICLPLAKLGCEMIQIDQVVGGAFPPCWAKSHPHTPGEGRWKTDVFRRQLETMRETMRTVQPDSIVCFEEPNEHFNHLVGIQDYRDCESGADEWASVFNYLYHEYLPCFQSNPRRGNRIWQAHAAADGQMPFLTPTFRDGQSDKSPALVNGDFEKPKAGDAGFLGWDRLDGYNGEVWNGRMFVDRSVRHGGAASVRLEVKPGETSVQVSQNVPVSDTAFLGAGRRFRLSAWLKTGHSAPENAVRFCFLGGQGGPGGMLPFPKPEEGWKNVSATFSIPPGAELLRIMMHLNGDATAWVDGMKLEEVCADGSAQEVCLSGRGAYDAFMRRWVELYHGEGRDWLAFGKMVKPPRIVCGDQPYTMSFYGGRRQEGRKPNVFCAAYKSADGRERIAVVNATGAEQPVTMFRDGRRWTLTLAPDEIRLFDPASAK